MPVSFRGKQTCACVAKSLPLVELVMLTRGLINESLDIFQLGYSTGVAASAGSHARGGCTDVGQFSDAQIEVWRWAGWTMQRRYPPAFDPHAHGWPWGCTHLAPVAQGQATQWSNRQNGLINRGRVEGPWPVVDFRTGIKRMENELSKFADDITDNTVRRILAEIATKVWKTDGVIPNDGFTGNPANPNVAANTALVETFKEVGAVRTKVDAQGKQLDTLTKAIADLSAKLDQPQGPVA